jgi:hypothetical protein
MTDTSTHANASQFFIAGELCRHGYSAIVMAREISLAHRTLLETPGQKGQPHNDNKVRIVYLPPRKTITGWDISQYRDRWDLIEEKLKG